MRTQFGTVSRPDFLDVEMSFTYASYEILT